MPLKIIPMKKFRTLALLLAAAAITSCSSGWKCTKYYGSTAKPRLEKKVSLPYN
jgi:hypothetical protein